MRFKTAANLFASLHQANHFFLVVSILSWEVRKTLNDRSWEPMPVWISFKITICAIFLSGCSCSHYGTWIQIQPTNEHRAVLTKWTTRTHTLPQSSRVFRSAVMDWIPCPLGQNKQRNQKIIAPKLLCAWVFSEHFNAGWHRGSESWCQPKG